MRKLLLLLAVVPALALGSARAPAGVVQVAIAKSGFSPATLTVRSGDTVIWTNGDDAPHQVVSDTDAFEASPILQQGQSWSFTFTRKGRFAYHDGVRKALKGSIVVVAAPAAVTIGAAKATMTLGSPNALVGRVSSRKSGEVVLVSARTCGRVALARVGTLRTKKGGIWRLKIKPRRNTVYGARWRKVSSPGVQVAVRPRVALKRTAAGTYSVHVTADLSLAGRAVLLQRFDELEQTWRIAGSARLADAGTAAGGVVSAATIKSAATGRLRALFSAAQAAPCYAQATSNLLGG